MIKLLYRITAFFTGRLTYDTWRDMNDSQRFEWAMKQRWIALRNFNDQLCYVLTSEVYLIKGRSLYVRGQEHHYTFSSEFPGKRRWCGSDLVGLSTTHRKSPEIL